MRLSIRFGLLLFASCALLGGLTTSCGPAAPMPPPPRAADDIFADIDKVATQIGDLSIPELTEPAERAQAARFVPALQKLITLANELSANADPKVRSNGPVILSRYRPALVALNDAPTIAALERQAQGSPSELTTAARTDLLYGRWLKAPAAEQPKLADDAAALARDNPKSEALGSVLYTMTQTGRPAAPTVAKLEDAILQMQSGSAKRYGEQVTSIRKLRDLVDKRIVVTGPVFGTLNTNLSTDSLTGKVVLLDFWATWCGPCMRAMPHVQRLYKENHDKGLEVIGLSCDDDVPEVLKYLKSNPATAWPQLFNPMSPGWNPVATRLGISAIPAMILIDRKGVVRSVEAEQDLDALVAKLLAEPQ